MRVVHLNRSGERRGGVEAYLLALVEAQRARGASVELMHGENGGAIDIEAFAPDVVHIHGRFLSDEVERRLQREHVVVRSLHDFSFGCASGELWLRDGHACERAHGAGCVLGIAAHGCAHRADLRPALRRLRPVGRELQLVRDAGSVVAYSEFVRAVALRNGVDAARCRTIPYFTERAVVPVPPTAERTVVFAGRIVANKGLDVLIRALAEISHSWDRLLVAGDGWDRKRCELLARELGVASRVEFLGWLCGDETRSALEAASIVALPSRWPEPFGIVGIDAMAAARAVVASAAGGIPEWLDDGATGLLVPPGDESALAAALRSLLDDPARAAALGREGWNRVARFSTDVHVDALAAVYAEAA
jgi:glycosyltransferase involved in cell wall biosynthesis